MAKTGWGVGIRVLGLELALGPQAPGTTTYILIKRLLGPL